MAKKQNSTLTEEIGLCTKSKDGHVIQKNQSCNAFCKNGTGKKCENGCMELYQFNLKAEALQEGISLYKNSEINGHSLDVAVIFDGTHLTSMLYPLERKYEKEMEAIESYHLSRREKQVVELLIRGKSNAQIAKQLLISTVTLKTHLNNIYKKLPKSFRNRLAR